MALSNKLRAVNVQLDLKQICFFFLRVTCSLFLYFHATRATVTQTNVVFAQNFHWFSNNFVKILRGRKNEKKKNDNKSFRLE